MDPFEDKACLIVASSGGIPDVIRNSLQELNLSFAVENSERAIELIRSRRFDIIFIEENLGGGSLKANAVHDYVSRLSMAERRSSMIVLVGSSFQTLNAMQAFAHSVHLVIRDTEL